MLVSMRKDTSNSVERMIDSLPNSPGICLEFSLHCIKRETKVLRRPSTVATESISSKLLPTGTWQSTFTMSWTLLVHSVFSTPDSGTSARFMKVILEGVCCPLLHFLSSCDAGSLRERITSENSPRLALFYLPLAGKLLDMHITDQLLLGPLVQQQFNDIARTLGVHKVQQQIIFDEQLQCLQQLRYVVCRC